MHNFFIFFFAFGLHGIESLLSNAISDEELVQRKNEQEELVNLYIRARNKYAEDQRDWTYYNTQIEVQKKMQKWVDDLQPQLNEMSPPGVSVYLVILPKNQHWVTTGAGKEDNYYFQNEIIEPNSTHSVLDFHNYQAIILRKRGSDASSIEQELQAKEIEINKLYAFYFFDMDETWRIQDTIGDLASKIHGNFPSSALVLSVYRKGVNHKTCIHLLAYNSYRALRTDKLRSRPCVFGSIICGHVCIKLLLY